MHCPKCLSRKIKKNGFTHYGKQNHRCKECGRQFVANSTHYVNDTTRQYIKRALCERLSLRGISRVFRRSLTWVMTFSKEVWQTTPQNLNSQPCMLFVSNLEELQDIGIQMDEAWSFVGAKSNKVWIWIAFDAERQQVIDIHFGNRGYEGASALWNKIPVDWQNNCCFDTDDWKAYKMVIPEAQHYVKKILTQALERFNCTLRQRSSRLVRKTLSFSKSMENHELAIRYFCWQFNQEKAALHL
jgi:IS1 family transposase